MSEKMKKAEYLFCELSGVDESIVAQALAVRGKKARYNIRRSFAVLAAALLLVSVAVGSFLIGDFKTNDGDDMAHGTPTVTLDVALKEAEGSSRVMTYGEADDIDLFDNVTRIVWENEGAYRAIALSSSSEERQLKKAMESSFNGAETVSGSEESSTLVWISYGDGRVVTPYLKDSAGNVGYGELFEYDAEMIPTKELTEFVNTLVS